MINEAGVIHLNCTMTERMIIELTTFKSLLRELYLTNFARYTDLMHNMQPNFLSNVTFDVSIRLPLFVRHKTRGKSDVYRDTVSKRLT